MGEGALRGEGDGLEMGGGGRAVEGGGVDEAGEGC